MNAVAYILCNAVGELVVIPPVIDEVVGREVVAAGWLLYRVATG